MDTAILILILILAALSAVFSLLAYRKAAKGDFLRADGLERLEDSTERSLLRLRREIGEDNALSLERFSRAQREGQSEVFARQDQHLAALTGSVDTRLKALDERMAQMNLFQEKSGENLRNHVDQKLSEIRRDNEKSLGEIRAGVEEKLQSTLEERISRSFQEVSERLQQVYRGLGEMQTLAGGVGDLKRVLSNVKTRGILGEIQLGAILEEILAPEQYETDVETVPGSRFRVEFAVRLPGEGEGSVYLPIDSKFPADAYHQLMDAYDGGNPEEVKTQRALLESRLKQFAKDIRTKYVSPPHTTDFAILFLPTEGLYAEAVNMGMVEILQRSYKVNLAGPTTMAALLNSLQMGFRTLAIQKRSGEVWEVLGAVCTEFERFEEALLDTQRRIDQAGKGLDALVGVRTRQIRRKLKDVARLPSDAAEALLKEETDAEE
ncbi:MAG: DNA recombination protein RmuC [Clostridia bacterium]|nr:DNA recombination protein RmuC [Clostridia bacterium]